jgi:AcrR family transcriptional regulator
MSQQKKSGYHHGNLRVALMDAGFRSLETGHLEDLSLRALAKEVGVTPTAAYNHFADKMALMVEMKTEGFRRFDDFLTARLDTAKNACPEDKVRCLGRAYMAFAFEHPGIFNLIFFWTPEQKYLTDALAHAAACGENLLKNIVAEMLQVKGTELTDYQQSVASFSAWSMVHGTTLLLKTGVVDAVTYCGNWPPEFSSQNTEAQSRILEHLFEIQIEGLKQVLPGVQPKT